jgi:hypothetical protein
VDPIVWTVQRCLAVRPAWVPPKRHPDLESFLSIIRGEDPIEGVKPVEVGRQLKVGKSTVQRLARIAADQIEKVGAGGHIRYRMKR